jgi:hypothetical protein
LDESICITIIDQPFDYEQDLLESCAYSNVVVDRFLRTSVLLDDEEEDAREQILQSADDQAACWTLFRNHAKHYNRPHPFKRKKLNHDEDWQLFLREDNDSELKARFLRFLESALLVHEHNSQPNKPSFKLALNQFADVDATIVQSTDYWKEEWYQLWDDKSGAENSSNNTFSGRGLVLEGILFRKLSSLEQVQLAASTQHYSNHSRYREKEKKRRGKKKRHDGTSREYVNKANKPVVAPSEKQYIRVPV